MTVQNTALLRLLPMVRVLSWAKCSVLRRICKVQVRIKSAFFRISQFQLITLDMHRNWHKKTKTQLEEKICLFARIVIYQNEKWILDWKRNFEHFWKMKNATPGGTRTRNLQHASPLRNGVYNIYGLENFLHSFLFTSNTTLFFLISLIFDDCWLLKRKCHIEI